MQLIKTETRIIGAGTQLLRDILVKTLPNINEYEIKAPDNRVIGYDIPNTVKSSVELNELLRSKASLVAGCLSSGVYTQTYILDSKNFIESTSFSDSTAIKARVR